MAFHVVLVHGTGARGAEWTQPEKSTLCAHLKHAFGSDVSFSTVDWTGANTFEARVDGAGKLRAHVQTQIPKDLALVLIGHSHGGSVIAQALAQEEVFCKRVHGVIFLATPFVHWRVLPLSKHLHKGPALLAGFLCFMTVVLGGLFALAEAGWLERHGSWFALALIIGGLFIWAAVTDAVSKRLGPSQEAPPPDAVGRDTNAADPIGQLDLAILEERGLNKRTLLLRSTADEATSGLGAAQLAGRIASDAPALVWKMPQWMWRQLKQRTGLGGDTPPRWLPWAFLLLMLLFTIRIVAAWLPTWRALQMSASAIGGMGAWTFVAYLWIVNGLLLVLLLSVPLLIMGLPFKFLSLWLYGLRGRLLLRALSVEVSVEPAPPGEWTLHQLDARHFEQAVSEAREAGLRRDLEAHAHEPGGLEVMKGVVARHFKEAVEADSETTLAHSLVYNDPRAHRAIEAWLTRQVWAERGAGG